MEEICRNCELCNLQASLYCHSDNAFLCYSCDSKVHCANFLVARHLRSIICPTCHKIDVNHVSGAVISPSTSFFCRNCCPDNGGDVIDVDDDYDDDRSSSCSSCVSSTGEAAVEEIESTSSQKRKVAGETVRKREKGTVVVDLKVEGILVNWCRRIGFREEREIGKVVSIAVEIMSGCLRKITILPFRVLLAASFWICCQNCGAHSLSTCEDLKKVEKISGVPAKLILATEAKLSRVIKRRCSREDHEEGWAESLSAEIAES
ncbi:B-box zinc finger protein 32-like [Amaranthus tricolor]|uniref:B-box zinc finger protein 32-like n=1 Tax=Amaranthus tricolor TaxID=29722 RepID=UPI00258C624C|nr:B-box zinc finger protein 32-like [Amaranthus tricolor]